uniref:Uncharacterized protein n=1 Tax=Vibrio phage P018-4 TaxID=3229728 RepID=A0AB39AJW4_9CAUD
MSELDKWESLDLYDLPKFEKWMCVSPKGPPYEEVRTGCGIIVDVETIPEKRQGLYDSKENKLYTVMTDFGNTFKLTLEELESTYVATRKESAPKGRFKRQQELLKTAWDKWFDGV